MLYDSFMIGENMPVQEILAEPYSTEAMSARDVLEGLRDSLEWLMAQKAEVENQFEPASWRGHLVFPRAEDGGQLTLNERAAYLRNSYDRIHIEDFVRSGAVIGAERMDVARQKQGQEPIHLNIVQRFLTSERADAVLRAGHEDVHGPLDSHIHGVGAHTYAKFVYDHVDPNLLNVPVLLDAFGYGYGANRVISRWAILSLSLVPNLKNQKWSPRLKGLAAIVAMHHSAMRSARQLINPVLRREDNLPQIKANKEEDFWERKLFGNEFGMGALYFVGYLEKSRAAMPRILKAEWGPDYVRNRKVLTSTLLMRDGTFQVGDKEVTMREIRRPILLLIKEGYFEVAYEQLQSAARAHPKLFSRFGLQLLLGKDALVRLDDDQNEALD